MRINLRTFHNGWLLSIALLAFSHSGNSASIDPEICARQASASLKTMDRASLAVQIWGAPPQDSDAKRSQALLGAILSELGKIRSVQPLAKFPDGRTEKLEIGVTPPNGVLFTGYSFMLDTGAEGSLPTLISIRNDSSQCRLLVNSHTFPRRKGCARHGNSASRKKRSRSLNCSN